jgi:hypothetical protein
MHPQSAEALFAALATLSDERWEETIYWMQRAAVESARLRGRLRREFIRAVEPQAESRRPEAHR